MQKTNKILAKIKNIRCLPCNKLLPFLYPQKFLPEHFWCHHRFKKPVFPTSVNPRICSPYTLGLLVFGLTSRMKQQYFSQFLFQKFCFLVGFIHLFYHFLNWRNNFMLLCPLFFSALLLLISAHLFQAPNSLSAKSVLLCHRQSRLSSHNSPGITVDSCVYILGKINLYLICFLIFPLSIFYRPLQ